MPSSPAEPLPALPLLSMIPKVISLIVTVVASQKAHRSGCGSRSMKRCMGGRSVVVSGPGVRSLDAGLVRSSGKGLLLFFPDPPVAKNTCARTVLLRDHLHLFAIRRLRSCLV